MIEDAALRELFRAESEEHLQRLDDALLQLEKTPTDLPLLEEAFREAHSLKGAARMLGLTAIQTPANQLEDQFNAARRNVAQLDANSLAQMALLLDEIRSLTHIALATAEAKERSGKPAPTPTSAPTPAQPVPTPAAKTAEERYQIESVRVATQGLDALLTHASELVVTSTRFAHRLAEVDALIELSEGRDRNTALPPNQAPQNSQVQALLTRLRGELGEDSARLNTVACEIENGIRRIRLLPLSNVFKVFARMVHDLAQEQGKAVKLVIEGADTHADKRILEEIKDPLMHMLRNAVDHGIEPPAERLQRGKASSGMVRIRASQSGGRILIELSDDGRGLDPQAIQRAALERGLVSPEELQAMNLQQIHALIFAPGMSTTDTVTEISGRGVGMSVVSTNLQRLKGSIDLSSTPGQGTHFTISLPVTLASLHVLLVGVNGHTYALPVECVRSLQAVAAQDLTTIEGQIVIRYQQQAILVARLADLLELPGANAAPLSSCVVFSNGGKSFGIFVDELLGEQEVMLKSQSALLERVRNVAGATILGNGEICMVLSAADLAATLCQGSVSAPPATAPPAVAKKVILLVEDSVAMRTHETRILQGAGYEVVSAADGLQAWAKLTVRKFDAVVTDVMMPHLDGLGLASRIRSDPRYHQLPIILVTSLASDDDRRRGLDAGADAYLTKATFDQQSLLDCLKRVIG